MSEFKENFYREVFNGMSKAFVLVAMRGKTVDAIMKSVVIETNGAFELISGFGRNEVVGREMGDVFSKMLPEWFEKISRACQGNETAIFECGLTGQLIIYKTEIFMIDDNTLALIIEDITDWKLANEQIKFQAFLLDNVNCAIGATDFNGRYIYWNRHMEELFQWTREEVIGKHILDIRLTEDMKNNDREIFEQLQKTGYLEFETMCPRKDKTAFPAHVIVASLKNDRGDIIALVGIHTDITEQKKLADAVRLSDERWRFALEGSGDGVFDHNLVTGEVYYSERWRDIVGISEKEATVDIDSWFLRICPEDREEAKKLFYDHIEGRSDKFVCEHRIWARGAYKWVLSRAKVIERTAGGAPARVIGTLSDIDEFKNLEKKYIETRKKLVGKFTYNDIVGRSPQILRIINLLPAVAAGDCNVLIEGPSGTGKNLIARTIHSLSERRDSPLVIINCGALPENLLESELFGYAKGAFTDARKDYPGKIQAADGGIVMLDEIGDLPLSLQVKLLHFIEEKRYEPLGSLRTVKANVRIIAATNRNLIDMVRAKKFREDLYYRLRIVHLSIPHLRDRLEDIEMLIEHYIIELNDKYGKKITGLSSDAYELLMSHDYPGNVRELRNILEHAFVFCHEEMIGVRHFPEEYQARRSGPSARRLSGGEESSKLGAAKTRIEEQSVLAALKKFGWNRNKVADYLCISRVTLWRLMKKFGMIS